MRHLAIVALALLAAVGGLAAPGAYAAPAPSHWCGADQATEDRVPDAVASHQVHVVYAIPADGADQFSQRALPIARDLAAVDSWWRLQDPGRTPRFDFHAFPGCDTAFGGLDITAVRLSQPGTRYAPLDLSAKFALLFTDMSAALGSLNDAKKYLVYYDGPVAPGLDLCGFSSRGPTGRGGSVSVVLLNANPAQGFCGSVGASDYAAETAAHELLHNLGAVPDEAPHQCSSGHVCEAANDIMRPGGTSNSLFDYALDVGQDDYYAHGGAWWDVQDSPWLSHLNAPQFPLTVSFSGGKGTVESDLPGIACPPACSIAWDSGTEVQLTATPEGERGRFAGWSGGCTGDVCLLTMDGPKTVTAQFVESHTLHVKVARRGGAGKVTGAQGIECSNACDFDLDEGTTVALRAVPDKRSRLLSWSVRSCGARPVCTVSADSDKTVTATFGPGSFRLTAVVAGQGTVTSVPSGLSCPRTCSTAFPYGRAVVLTARSAAGWKFVGWSGSCRGAGACRVRVTKASFVRASFRRA